MEFRSSCRQRAVLQAYGSTTCRMPAAYYSRHLKQLLQGCAIMTPLSLVSTASEAQGTALDKTKNFTVKHALLTVACRCP
jgi:hypothetical protein